MHLRHDLDQRIENKSQLGWSDTQKHGDNKFLATKVQWDKLQYIPRTEYNKVYPYNRIQWKD